MSFGMDSDDQDFDLLAIRAHEIAKGKGFWDSDSEVQVKGVAIALMHSELSECLEAIRKPGPDQHCPQFSGEVIELADVIIRIFDYATAHDLPLRKAVVAKMNYNESRPHKHGKAF